MSNLAGAPFFLKPESAIQTRVRAVNAVGTSLSSPDTTKEVLLAGLPPVMDTPYLGDRSDDKLEICWSRTGLAEAHDVEFFWGTHPRTSDCNNAACGLDNVIKQKDKAVNCMMIQVNPAAQQLYRFVVRASNDCGPAPYSPELTVNLCGPNCHHSFQSSVPSAPVFVPNQNTLPPPATEEEVPTVVHEVDDGHAHVHEAPVEEPVIVEPVVVITPTVVVEIKPNTNMVMPTPILPENMVQECDSQTGRCWFTTKPEVIPVIGTSASTSSLEPMPTHQPSGEPVAKPDTQGWSSG